MTLDDVLPNLMSGGLWTALGVGITKGADFLLAKRRQEGDHTVAMVTATNSAQQALVDGLFAQIKLLEQQVAVLNEENEKWRTEAHAATIRVAQLEVRLAKLEANSADNGHPEETPVQP